QQPALQSCARDITSLGSTVLIIAFMTCATLMPSLSGDGRAVNIFLGMIGTACGIVTLKILIGRPCPDCSPILHGMSFPVGHLPCMPSGHTMGSVMLYGMLASLGAHHWPDYSRWIFAWGFGIPVVVGITRLILSAHWMSDVVAGFLLAHSL